MATKRKATKKKDPGEILVDIDLGSLDLTEEQVDRLKIYIQGQVLTWIADDVGESPVPVITCNEHGGGGPGPAPGPGNGPKT